MKFRMFTDEETGCRVAVNVDHVKMISDHGEGTCIYLSDRYPPGYVIKTAAEEDIAFWPNMIFVREDFHTVISRLNTIAE